VSLAAGTRLGRYEIVAPLGKGGMGEVYIARDTRLGRNVAVKVLSERLVGDPQALARFEREARAVAALSHPNILALFDVGEEQGTSYVVTELLDGETLRDRLKRSPLPRTQTIEIAIGLAEALAAALDFAYVYCGMKDMERAIEWLERAYQERSAWLVWIASDPRLDWLRQEPGFQNVMARMGLSASK
jgi:hypothetical protein